MEQDLERLRVAVDADGIAFVQAAGIRRRVIGGNGLQPTAAAPRAQPEARRIVLNHQHAVCRPARVAQSSALAWPDTVSCLIAVPITVGGQSRGVLELVNERPRRATDADMALIRVVANRAAGFDGNAYGEAGAVA